MKLLFLTHPDTVKDVSADHLEDQLFEPFFLHTFEDAQNYWDQHQPPLVVLDVDEEELQASDLIKEIRKNRREVFSFILVLAEKNNREKYMSEHNLDVDDYLEKPFKLEELYHRIRLAERVISGQEKNALIFALVELMSVKDTETGQHVQRVQEYCRVLAEAIQKKPKYQEFVNRKFLDSLYLATALHDIGKVAVSDSVLLKEGKLTQAEWEVMKSHTTIGDQAVASVLFKYPHMTLLEMAREIIRHHHEWYDGSGYPDQLSGEDIPLSARITAIADVYDSLTSERSYKDAFTHQEAKRLIIKGSGSQFDPELVKVFLENEQKFIDIRKNMN